MRSVPFVPARCLHLTPCRAGRTDVKARGPDSLEIYRWLRHAEWQLEQLPSSRLTPKDQLYRLIARGQTLEHCIEAMVPGSPHYCRKARRLLLPEVHNYLVTVTDFLHRHEAPAQGFGAFLLRRD